MLHSWHMAVAYRSETRARVQKRLERDPPIVDSRVSAVQVTIRPSRPPGHGARSLHTLCLLSGRSRVPASRSCTYARLTRPYSLLRSPSSPIVGGLTHSHISDTPSRCAGACANHPAAAAEQHACGTIDTPIAPWFPTCTGRARAPHGGRLPQAATSPARGTGTRRRGASAGSVRTYSGQGDPLAR